MSDNADQNLANHTRFYPLYHFVGAPLVMVVLGWSGYRAFRVQTPDSVLMLLMAVAIFILFALVRQFPLKAQDRVIRLEEQLRLTRLLPADMQSRIGEFTVDQLVAMRFASDAELPELARWVLTERPTGRKTIKGRIRKWRPDTFRI